VAANDVDERRAAASLENTPDSPVPVESGGHRLVIRANAYNQCYVEATTGQKGARFRFLLDSGAATVTFGSNHAAQLGLEPSTLRYDGSEFHTSNGIVHAANIRLRELRIGDFSLRDFPATVNPAAIDNPLLGTSVLGKEVDFQVRRGFCVLTLRSAENVERPDRRANQARSRGGPLSLTDREVTISHR
jgi:clan AA aspartic protease (TIGR02281 family)